MKLNLILLSLVSTIAFAAFGQSKEFQNLQGIKKEGITFYDAEGYQIFQEVIDIILDEKGINKVKKKYSIPKETVVSTDSELPGVKILNYTEVKGASKMHSTYYLLSNKKGKATSIGFSTFCERDKSIEKQYFEAIINNLIPKEIFTPEEVDTVQFAGRFIDLGPACRWMGVRNLQCPNMGQMNWSEFSSAERALQMIERQRILNSELKLGEVLEDNEIEVIFEGTPITALKRKLKIKIPQLIMGGSNILIIYYVTAEINGRHVACVLSHYTDDINSKKLPPLLSEVMQFKD